MTIGNGGEPRRYPVTFHGEAAREWREAFPELPPGEELVLYMRAGPCVVCGAPVDLGELGAIEPKGVTDDGTLVGDCYCIEHAFLDVEGGAP